jgi:hypothetical protein
MPKPDRMTPDGFRAALDVLGETQGSFAELLVGLGDVGADKARTVQRWAAGQQDIPGAIAALLQVLVLLQDNSPFDTAVVRSWLADAVVEDDAVG